MSAGTITVANAWTGVERIVKNINDVSMSGRLELADIVDEQIRGEIINAAPERLTTSSSISVVSGTTTYALPSDFEDVSPTGTGFYRLDDDGEVETRLVQTGFGSQSDGYYLDSSNVILTPTPTEAKTITLRYIPERTDFTVDTEFFSAPNGKKYLELVRQGLLVQYYLFKRRLDLKQAAEADYQALVADLISNVNQTPNVQRLIDTSISY